MAGIVASTTSNVAEGGGAAPAGAMFDRLCPAETSVPATTATDKTTRVPFIGPLCYAMSKPPGGRRIVSMVEETEKGGSPLFSARLQTFGGPFHHAVRRREGDTLAILVDDDGPGLNRRCAKRSCNEAFGRMRPRRDLVSGLRLSAAWWSCMPDP